jgi:hypothetical protein
MVRLQVLRSRVTTPLQVMPFHPHKEAATLDLGVHCAPTQAYQQALDSEAELKRVQNTVLYLRSGIYQQFDQVCGGLALLCLKSQMQPCTYVGGILTRSVGQLAC